VIIITQLNIIEWRGKFLGQKSFISSQAIYYFWGEKMIDLLLKDACVITTAPCSTSRDGFLAISVAAYPN
jgi:hypothetical protein